MITTTPGTRAVLKGYRMSASKVREVLDLIRGKDIIAARDILVYSERGAAKPILKVLASAVANAENNDGIPGDELFVSACYADEGPTLKRFKPRARGRASQILKRTSHITIIVSRMDSSRIAEISRKRSVDATRRAERRSARVRGSGGGDAASAEPVAASVETVEAEILNEEVTIEAPLSEEVSPVSPVVEDEVASSEVLDAEVVAEEGAADASAELDSESEKN